jgi:hypothetical protein
MKKIKMSKEAHVWLASSMSNDKKAGLYGSYSMCCIQKEVVATMPTTVFNLLVPS